MDGNKKAKNIIKFNDLILTSLAIENYGSSGKWIVEIF